MIIKFPPENKKILQTNISDLLGNMWSSFNLDLTSNLGRIRVSPRGVIISDTSSLANMTSAPVAFRMHATNFSDAKIWAIAGTHMWYNGGRPQQTFTEDANSGTPTVGVGSDMDLFNGSLYVVGTFEIRKWDGSAWTEIGADIGQVRTSCCTYAGRFYYVRNTSSISSIDTTDSNTNATSLPNTNPYTLKLSINGAGSSDVNSITSIRASSNRIWIATSDLSSQNYSAGRVSRIFEWDGVSTLPNREYIINSVGVLALVIKDDIPYAVDADGRLLKFTGSSFTEVARLPIPIDKYLRNPNNSQGQRFIHARGITVKNGRIQMLINGSVNDTTQSIIENLPSGIWEYDENIGLYHKYSISQWLYGTTTTRTDFGQNRVEEVGALFNVKSTSDSSSLNGDLMMGVSYRINNSTTRHGIFINDSDNLKSKVGYLVTTKIDSPNVLDNWQKIYATHKKLLDSTDRICLKYRTSESPAIEGAITWTSTTIFTSTLNLSSFAVGDEVEITSGTGGGQTEHITAISESSGTYTVTLANAVTGATGTATARFQKWISLGEQTSQEIDYKEFSIAKEGSWIQIKLVMYFTGDDELNYLQLVSATHIPTT